MTTLGGLRDEILDEMERAELSTQAATAIKSAIKHYEKERFAFNEVRASSVTDPDVEFYSLPTDVIEIDSLTITANNGTYLLDEVPYGSLEDIYTNPNFTGKPSQYAVYDEQLRLYPIPDATHSLMMSYVFRLPELSATSDTNAWLDVGKELVKYRAKADLYINLVRDQAMAALMKAMESEAYDAMTEKSLRRTTGGGVRPYL